MIELHLEIKILLKMMCFWRLWK